MSAALTTPEHARALAVLVVDDDDASREGLVRAVGALGYDCASARDGIEALEMFAQHRFDVILSDWEMPRLDGLGLCNAVRKGDREYTYFAFVSGRRDMAHIHAAMEAGADDYMSKPVDVDAMEVRLLAARRVIDTHQKLNARYRAARTDSQRNFQLAHFDTLTGVRNRLALAEDMRGARESMNRYGSRCAVAMVDIDKFKLFNDQFGHVRGDAVLRQIADVMQHALRSGDRLYRYGGEEFVVLLREQTLEGAVNAMQRVRCAVEAATIHHADASQRPYVTISAGVADLTPHDDDDMVIRRADGALYIAKSAGRNQVNAAPPPALNAEED